MKNKAEYVKLELNTKRVEEKRDIPQPLKYFFLNVLIVIYSGFIGYDMAVREIITDLPKYYNLVSNGVLVLLIIILLIYVYKVLPRK